MLVTIKSYLTLPEATAMQALLESEGVPCVVKDTNVSVIAPFLANAIGGIKLLVQQEDAEQAIGLLKEAGYIKPETEQEQATKNNKSLLVLLLAMAAVLLYFIARTIPR